MFESTKELWILSHNSLRTEELWIREKLGTMATRPKPTRDAKFHIDVSAIPIKLAKSLC